MRRAIFACALGLAPLGCSVILLNDNFTDGPDRADASVLDAPARIDGDAIVEASSSADVVVDETSTPTYAAAVLADSPVSYWRFDDPTRDILKDEMKRHDLRSSNTVGVTPGRPGVVTGSAVNLDGNTELVLDGNLDLGPSQKLSIEAWIKPTDTQDNYRRIFAKVTVGNGGPADGSYLWVNSGTENVGFERWNDKTPCEAMYWPHRPPTDAFTHVVVVITGGRNQLYINGLFATAGISENPMPASDPGIPVSIGAGFIGTLDEMAYYDKALTAERVKAHYDAAMADKP